MPLSDHSDIENTILSWIFFLRTLKALLIDYRAVLLLGIRTLFWFLDPARWPVLQSPAVFRIFLVQVFVHFSETCLGVDLWSSYTKVSVPFSLKTSIHLGTCSWIIPSDFLFHFSLCSCLELLLPACWASRLVLWFHPPLFSFPFIYVFVCFTYFMEDYLIFHVFNWIFHFCYSIFNFKEHFFCDFFFIAFCPWLCFLLLVHWEY